MEAETIPLDVLFVGGGPASLAGAYHLMHLAEEHNRRVEQGGEGEMMELQVALIEKADKIGQHALSGAVFNPSVLAELIPDYRERGCPLEKPVESDSLYFLTRKRALRVPHVLLPFDNRGYFTLSLQKFTAWLAEQVEASGAFLFPSTTGVEVLYDENGDVRGVRTGDKGLDADGNPKGSHTPGVVMEARATVLGEGPYGTLTEDLIHTKGLREGKNPQIYSLGVKEVIQVPEPQRPDEVIHTMGFPLRRDQFGGGFCYPLKDNLYSVGLVASLDWKNPNFDAQQGLQEFKSHPLIRSFLTDGEILSYGAKTIPEGGFHSLPRPYCGGALIVGDSAGFVSILTLKGIHYAMKSGMLAAETLFQALREQDTSAESLSRYEERLRESLIVQDLRRERNFRPGFRDGMLRGMLRFGWQRLSGGGRNTKPLIEEDYTTFGHAREFAGHEVPEDALTIDKRTAVHKAGSLHREDQPSHIHIVDPGTCIDRCIPRHGTAPCTHFCPAEVYELVEESEKGKRIQINFSNCVHCKTCVILDPYDVDGSDHIQNIDWRAPHEGGPKYSYL